MIYSLSSCECPVQCSAPRLQVLYKNNTLSVNTAVKNLCNIGTSQHKQATSQQARSTVSQLVEHDANIEVSCQSIGRA